MNSFAFPDVDGIIDGDVDGIIDGIEVYRIDVRVARHFSFGTWHNRQHAFLRLTAGGHSGWGEEICARNDLDFDAGAWAAPLAALKGLTVSDALARLASLRGKWNWHHLEIAEMALLDLLGRIAGRPAIEMLGLGGREPVPGMFCVLEEEIDRAVAQARLSLEKNLRSHLKVKIFGKPEFDAELIAAVRAVMGPDACITADANAGYAHKRGEPLDDLERWMRGLRAAGLDACEDPADLTNEEWAGLQARVGDLALLPDYPCRPAWGARETLLPGMGRIYNLHPGCMGSLIECVRLGRQIGEWGARVMIGDDSLIGPACTVWQQIAIGLGAVWGEALEKPEESDAFARAARSLSTAQMPDGRFGIAELRPGFGADIDLERLRAGAGGFWSL